MSDSLLIVRVRIQPSRFLRCIFLALACAFLGLCPGATAADGDTTSVLVTRALRATADRHLDEAASLYLRVANVSPDEGYPLLARFLARTGQTSAALDLVTSPALIALRPSTRARIAISAGDAKSAVAILSSTASTSELYLRTVLLAGLLRQQGKHVEASAVLADALGDPVLSPADRRDLFMKLVMSGSLNALMEKLLPTLRDVAAAGELDYPEIRALAVEALNAADGKPGFAEFRSGLERIAGSSAFAAWLAAVVAARRGDVDTSRALLEPLTSRVLERHEKLLAWEELARLLPAAPDRAIRLYSELLEISPNPDRIRLSIAQLHFGARRYADACVALAPVDRAKLDESRRRIAGNMRLTAMAKSRPAADVVRAFEEESRGMRWGALRELAEAPFALLPETSDHLQFRNVLQARLRETTAPVELYALMMSTEDKLRSGEVVIAALHAYVEARPDEAEALREYAGAVAAMAFGLVAGSHETTPTAQALQATADEASKALWKLAQSRPYDPEPYQKLMALYNLFGLPDKARMVPAAIASRTSVTAEEVHLAAFLLAGAGLTTDSIPLYRRSLVLSPGSGKYLMNLAAALAKTGGGEEAAEIYCNLMLGGSHGRQYHAHQLHEDSYELAESRGKLGEHMEFLRGLSKKADLPGRGEFLLDAGKLMFARQRPDDSVMFLEIAMKTCPEEAAEAENLLANAYAMKGDMARAGEILKAREKRAKTKEEAIDARFLLAALHGAHGDAGNAVAEWKQLARDYPGEPAAARGYLAAAQTLMEKRDFAAARQLLDAYLAMNPGDSDAERSARELLNKCAAGLEPGR